MATLVLSAAGAALGAGFGGTVLGLSGAVIGRAMGATLGRMVDQRLMGGSDAVETGRIDRLRLTSAGEGGVIPRLWGRARLGGQVIWASPYVEDSLTSGGGKGRPSVTQYSYRVSLAIALCQGEILKVGRIWADGEEITPKDLNLRVYKGGEDQLPDPKITAVEGQAPAYRGLAYVVIEDLELAPYGNRIPQFSFEVARATGEGLQSALRAVAMIPGTGEYSLAATPVHFEDGLGGGESANCNSPSGLTDFASSLEHLTQELPNCGATSLVVSWFGDDLRAGVCEIRPKVEQKDRDGKEMPWRAGGIERAEAGLIARQEGRSVYGGTPSDQAVIEAIKALKAAGQEVMFYPFILMEQMAGNGLPDPYGKEEQPVMPWRGRVTTAVAAGRKGSADRSAAAEKEVAHFFGTALADDFIREGEVIRYHGPEEWGLRRFILHYAHLCVAAGGVEAFCIGSEMVGLTRIRGAADAFPAVMQLCDLAQDVRRILGPQCKISYAADWTEYGSYVADGNVYFPLDPLWAHEDIDFIGIDNYMPLSDWREGEQADQQAGSIYDLAYLQANIEGGEGYDWYYDSPEGEAAQRRRPIEDGAYAEPWVYRVKDLRSWWTYPHHQRVGSERAALSTPWMPMSKPIRFTEYGCAAIDRGANHPNRFLDLLSSESILPRASTGRRDDVMQMQYLRAFALYWGQAAHNPTSDLYGGRMLDLAHCYAWAWDARPYPQFPAYEHLWSDSVSYGRGHWLNGRATNQPLGNVIADICAQAGVSAVDVTRAYGALRGYVQSDVQTARAALQPLLLAYGIEAADKNGVLHFRKKGGESAILLEGDTLVEGGAEHLRTSAPEQAGTMRLGFVGADASYEPSFAEARLSDIEGGAVEGSEMPLVLTAAEAKAVVHRWLAEAEIARQTVKFALPPSRLDVTTGTVLDLERRQYRVERVERAEALEIEASRYQASVYDYGEFADSAAPLPKYLPSLPVLPLFLDLPLVTGREVAHQPFIAVAAKPWRGPVAVWERGRGFALNRLVTASAMIGKSETALWAAPLGQWDRGAALRIKFSGGGLQSASKEEVLNGANLMAIGDGRDWELFQFTQAELVGPNLWEVSQRLRGQQGSEAIMPDQWPIGSWVVVINSALAPIDLPLETREIARDYRIGLAARGYDDPQVVGITRSFDAVGLRPYAVAHLRLQRGVLQWKRRTRVNGDSWAGLDVPLGEDREAYLVRVMAGTNVLLEEETTSARFDFSPIEGATRIGVAQISQTYGIGPWRWLDLS